MLEDLFKDQNNIYYSQGWRSEGLPEGWLGKADPKGYSFVNLVGKDKALGAPEEDVAMVQAFTYLGHRVEVKREVGLQVVRVPRTPKLDSSWVEGGAELPEGWRSKGEGSSRRIMDTRGRALSSLRFDTCPPVVLLSSCPPVRRPLLTP